MTIEHRPGTQHRNADALSRRPCRQCHYDPNWESASTKTVTNIPEREETQEKTLQELQEEDREIVRVSELL